MGLALLVLSAALGAVLDGSFLPWILGGVACCGALALAAVLALRRAGRASAQADQVLARYSAGSGEEIAALAGGLPPPGRDSPGGLPTGEGGAGDTGGPESPAGEQPGRSALLCPRLCPGGVRPVWLLRRPLPALNLEGAAGSGPDQAGGARRLFDELAAQGGQALEAMPEGLTRPERPREETEEQLAAVTAALEQVERLRSMALGEQRAVGDPPALAARREEPRGAGAAEDGV